MTSPSIRRREAGNCAPRSRRRAADAATVLVSLDTRASTSLQHQVYDGLRDAILAGRLAPDARLPSTRSLAADLGVSRTTVSVAFDQLRAEGYIVGHRGGGTRVRQEVPDVVLEVRPKMGSPVLHHSAARVIAKSKPRLSSRGRMLVDAGARMVTGGGSPARPFRLGVPALDAFPARLWARLSARRWRAGTVHLGDADPAGELALREAIATYVSNARGARCSPDQVIVVSGTQQALDLVARVLLDVGDEVWVEDPGYGGAHAAFAAAGARVVAVPVDDEGMDVEEGERRAPRARMAYVTPSHQFPLGFVMSAPRRLALLAWARRADAWVVEDDYDSEFRYAGRPLPCLQGLDAEQRPTGEPARVLYVGTFNKTIVPGMRLGYLVVPDTLVDALRASRASSDRHPPTFMQGILTDFIGEGHYARHVRRLRALYSERQHVLLDAAAHELEGLLTMEPDCAGLHLVGWLSPGMSDVAAEAAALAEGVEVSALSRFALLPSECDVPQGLLLSYAGYDRAAIRAGVRRLRKALVASQANGPT